ncbi:MAG: CheA signal transduction histidine kinase [Verrucomicrobiales bacterium]|nr:CheA signal transduction histidine kinase [Verrucomicrobiales bacterium]
MHLEEGTELTRVDAAVIEELFRRFHSFKGISAIVGLQEAESLAHATEDVLRGLKQGKIEVNQKLVDLLMSSTQFLEQSVLAFRAQKPQSNPGPLIKDLSALDASASTSHSAGKSVSKRRKADFEQVASVPREDIGLLKWKCTFIPSKVLDEKGINVTSVREKLSAIGEIVKATPQVRGEGLVAFEFILVTKETPSDVADWEASGIVTELMDQPRPDQAVSGSSAPSVAYEIEQNPFIAPSHVIRVDLKRLDELMRIVGEMVIQKSRSDQVLTLASRGRGTVEVSVLKESNLVLTRNLRDLRQALMKVRLVPVAEIFARMPFVTRDLSRETNKKARLVLRGQQTEIDKYLIEKLKEPLLHLVRNAFAHGIENPRERIKAGKPEEATIELKASTIGDSVIIQIRDDGRGINREAVTKKARALGVFVPEVLDNRALLDILCGAGFSTREEADRAAGRGVGMAVVRKTITELGGTIMLETVAGKSTEFTLRMPLTLAIAETIIVSSGGQTCAIPQSFVLEVLRIESSDIRSVNRVDAIPYRDGILPVIRLESIFGLQPEPRKAWFVLVLTCEKGSVGLVAEQIHGQKEVVVRAMQDPLIQVSGVSGATELGDGKPVLILNAAELFNGAVRPPQRIPVEAKKEEEPAL